MNDPRTIAKCVVRYLRMSPRKVRYVVEPLRDHTVADALNMLAAMNRRACRPVALAIASAFANAKQQDPAAHEDRLVLNRVLVDGGPAWKRFRAAAFGRAASIRKHTSHLTIELAPRASSAAPTRVPPAAPRQPARRAQAGRTRSAAATKRTAASHGT